MHEKTYVIGIDEVGRGPVAGPVTVCACAIKHGVDILLLFPDSVLLDSKKLTEKKRLAIVEKLSPLVDVGDVIFGTGEVSASRIDEIGISLAIKKAMSFALEEIHAKGVSRNSFVYLDGSLHADETYKQETIIKGDEKIPSIALASILAKTDRDMMMKKVGDAYPLYGFASHVGYGTAAHLEAIKKHGLTPLHRRSFLKKIIL
jgi:ribonuclease HII